MCERDVGCERASLYVGLVGRESNTGVRPPVERAPATPAFGDFFGACPRFFDQTPPLYERAGNVSREIKTNAPGPCVHV